MAKAVQPDHDVLIPPQWSDTIVMDALYCRRCGYDLRTLNAAGRCPECGLPIWTSIQHTVDPAGSRLPSIRNPRAVGNGLLILTLLMLTAVLLLFLPDGLFLLNIDLNIGGGRRGPAFHAITVLVAGVLALGIVWSIRLLAPPRGQEVGGSIWQDIWRIAIGSLGWLVAAVLWIEFRNQIGITGIRQRVGIHLALTALATIAFMGLRGVFNVIGQRSREYRRSKGGRQNVELIIAATAAGFLASVAYAACQIGWIDRDSMFLLRTIIWASHLMVIIGLAYLVMNAWWIRRALRRPPPALDQVLVPQLPPDTWIPDREE